jgi:hypothetical protein
MSTSLDSDLDILKQAMKWIENGEEYPHIDAYNFGKSLIPLLKTNFNDSSTS